jgi:arylsulfatase
MASTRILVKLDRSERSFEEVHVKTLRRYGILCATIVASAFATCVSGCGNRAQTPQEGSRIEARPNILLIVCDALRADRIAASRDNVPLMPNVRRYADTSWNYTNARVQATWTKPSMASIFTSLYPEVHQVLFGIHDTLFEGQPPQADVLTENQETLATYLKANGYATAGIQANANISAAFGFDQGFDSYEFSKYPEFHARVMTDHAIATIESIQEPFFLYAHYMDTHAPYDPPEPYREKLGPAPPLPEADEALLKDYATTYIDRILYEVELTKERRFGNLSAEGEEYVRYCYDGESLYLDTELGRLLDYVHTNSPNTLVVLTADHGEELWEHGSIGHGKTVYEELARVPLIIRVPGQSPRRVESPVETIDILPTLANLAGLQARPAWQGRIISGHDGLDVQRSIYTSTQMSIPGSKVNLAAVVKQQGKLILDQKTEHTRFFDLETDPLEKNPTEDTAATAPLKEIWIRHMNLMQEHPSRPTERATTEVDPETEESLKSIGYGR